MNDAYELWQQYAHLLARQHAAIEAGDADELDALLAHKDRLLEELGSLEIESPVDVRLREMMAHARAMEAASVDALEQAMARTAQQIGTARRRRVEARAAGGGNIACDPAPRYLNRML